MSDLKIIFTQYVAGTVIFCRWVLAELVFACAPAASSLSLSLTFCGKAVRLHVNVASCRESSLPQDADSPNFFTFDNKISPQPLLSLHCPSPALLTPAPVCHTLSHPKNTHTHTRHRWVALSLSGRWIGKYLPRQIVFLPLSSSILPAVSFPPNTSTPHSPRLLFFLFLFLAVVFQGCSVPAVSPSSYQGERSQASVVQTRRHARTYLEYMMRKDGWYVYAGRIQTCMHVRRGLGKQRVDDNWAGDNAGVLWSVIQPIEADRKTDWVLIWSFN